MQETLPDDLTYGTVVGSLYSVVTGTTSGLVGDVRRKNVQGRISFVPSVPMVGHAVTGDLIHLETKVVPFSATTGEVNLKLVATDCPALTVVNWTYLVKIEINRFLLSTKRIFVPGGTTVQVGSLVDSIGAAPPGGEVDNTPEIIDGGML